MNIDDQEFVKTHTQLDHLVKNNRKFLSKQVHLHP